MSAAFNFNLLMAITEMHKQQTGHDASVTDRVRQVVCPVCMWLRSSWDIEEKAHYDDMANAMMKEASNAD